MSEHEQHDAIAREERDIYAIIVAASLPVVIGLLIEGGSMDGGATLSLLLVAVGVVGLLAGLRALVARRIPRAIVHRDP